MADEGIICYFYLIESCLVSTFVPLLPSIGLPVGFKALPAGSEALPAGSETLPAGSKALPAGSETLPAGSEVPFVASPPC